MKVIYKKPILDQIHAVIHEAKVSGKEIDHLQLTQKEAHDLRRACGMPSSFDAPKEGGILGVRFTVVEDFVIDEILNDIFNGLFKGVKPGETNAGRQDDCAKEKKKV